MLKPNFLSFKVTREINHQAKKNAREINLPLKVADDSAAGFKSQFKVMENKLKSPKKNKSKMSIHKNTNYRISSNGSYISSDRDLDSKMHARDGSASESCSNFSFLYKKGVTATEFHEDVKKHRPLFIKSMRKINPKLRFYYGPYERHKV